MLKLKLSKQIPLETTEQITFCQMMDLISKKYGFRYFAVGNGAIHRNTAGKTNFGQIAKLKAEGQKSGFPDLVILSNGQSLFIEMKRQKGGTVSAEQKEWKEWLLSNCFDAAICKGAEEAYKVLMMWLVSRCNVKPF